MPGVSTTMPTGSAFASPAEFREVLDRAFTIMSEDAEMGPRLRVADTPQRFVFPDLGLVLNVRTGRGDEDNLIWVWSEHVAWEPRVTLTMSSAVAHRYFLGRENVAIAVARKRIRATGDTRAAVALLPLLRPLFARYREMIATHYPHLEA